MIRMTKQADYGIVLMTHMARQPERLFNAPELAGEANLSQPMVSKILKPLARAGLLESQRGVNGGYSLARTAEEISVADIIAAVDGPIAITECIDDGPGACSQEALCPVRGNWQLINEVIRRGLAGISLAEMTQPMTHLVNLGRGDTETELNETA